MAKGLGFVVEGTRNVRVFASVGYGNIRVHDWVGVGVGVLGCRVEVVGLWFMAKALGLGVGG